MNNRTLALSFITSIFLACFYFIGNAINYPAFTFALLATLLFSFSTLSLLKKLTSKSRQQETGLTFALLKREK